MEIRFGTYGIDILWGCRGLQQKQIRWLGAGVQCS